MQNYEFLENLQYMDYTKLDHIIMYEVFNFFLSVVTHKIPHYHVHYLDIVISDTLKILSIILYFIKYIREIIQILFSRSTIIQNVSSILEQTIVQPVGNN